MPLDEEMEKIEVQEQSNRIQRLLEEVVGEQGFLTLDQILEAFPEAEDDLDQLEELFDILNDQGIQVYDSGDAGQQEMIDMEKTTGGNGDHGSAADLSGIPTDDSIGLYLMEMSQVPLLTQEEEVALAKQLEQGRAAQRHLSNNGHSPQERERLKHVIEQGREARDHLIKANTRLVVSVAKRYRGFGMPFQDLIQAGNVGLIKAVDKFDYRRGYKLGTYATWWIRQAITRALSQQTRTIRIPVHMSDRIRRVYKTAQRLEQDLDRQPTPEEIAEEMEEWESEEVRWMLRISRQPISLDRPVNDEEDASEIGDFIEDEEAPPPTQSAEHRLLREDLEGMMGSLTAREAVVLRLRFGLNGDRTHTLKEVGDKLGVTRERARQIECEAIRKLRHPRHSRRLRGYLS